MGQINARDWVFEVESATASTWVEIGGLTSFTLNPGENEEVAETATFQSGGQYEEQKMQRGATLELEGRYIVTTSPTRDPGQLRVDALGALVGDESVGQVRFRHTSETNWTVWPATVTPGEVGGETNEKTGWAATFTRSGAATVAAVTP
jgi:hypothetical protein